MSPVKERLTVTVDRDVVEAANEAVSTGRASSVSTWVNTALAERAAKDRRLRALATAVSAYEAAFGEISEQELIAQQRQDRREAIVVRPPRKKLLRPRRRRTA